VQTYQVTVGNSSDFNPFVGSGGASGASFNVGLKEGADTTKITDDLRGKITGLSGVGDVTVGGDNSTGFDSSQLSVVVKAADPTVLSTATEQVRAVMAGTKDVTDVSTTLAASVPRLQVTVDRQAAAKAGLTEAAVGQAVAGAFRPAPAGTVTVDGASENVVVSFGTPPADPAALSALPIPTATGVVPLSSLAKVDQVAGPEEVTRIDGNRSATVNGTATGSNVGASTKDLTTKLTSLSLPAGASYEIGGVSQQQSDAFGDLGLAVLAAIAIVFVIMVATFRSLIQPVILLISIPFAATGAIALLLATGTPLGVPALIGVLMLVGIVVTNAIVLLDLINHYRTEGMGVREAVIEGGRHRLRPILMTAIATIFALLPMALGLTGEGGFISQPLAIVVIGGLVSSTLLTLVLVPTLYTMVENRKEKSRLKRERRRARKAAAAVTDAEVVSDDIPRHAAEGPDEPVPAGTAVPDSSGGAHEASAAEPSGALRGYTDQFEVLRVPRKPA
jgi:HAE1 family hydrophobic/amphiphilic exporter-1